MNIIDPILGLRIVFVLGIVNLVSVLAILLTCRCIPMWRLTRGINQYGWYKKVYRFHCYVWWLFIPSVVIHAVLAVLLTGIPF